MPHTGTGDSDIWLKEAGFGERKIEINKSEGPE